MDGNGPKQPIVQARIEIVNLIAAVRGLRPQIEVESNEGKSSLMVPPIASDVFAGHKSHVGVKGKRPAGWCCYATPRPSAEDIRGPQDAVEVGDRGKLRSRAGKKKMKDLAVPEEVESARNWFRQTGSWCRTENGWNCESSGERRTRANEVPTRKRGTLPEMGMAR